MDTEKYYCKSGDGCIPGERGHEGACIWEKKTPEMVAYEELSTPSMKVD